MRNAIEEIADEVFDTLRAGDAAFCICPQCRGDVITHALNKIRPRYVSGISVGSAVTRVALSHHQARTELTVIMIEAMRLVQAKPRHEPMTAERALQAI